MKKILSLFIFLLLLVGCSLANSPTSKVEDLLTKYQTLDKDIKTKASNKEAAKEVGAAIAKKALDKKVENVVFDRSGYQFHGIVKEFAEAAREAGLNF